MAPSDALAGRCQCGSVRYELDRAAVLTFYLCHCRECQKQASSAFGLSLKVPRDNFRLLAGALDTWERPTDSGGRSVANFCIGCGCRVFHGASNAPVISIKAGLLDDVSTLTPAGHIWTDSALPWVDTTTGVCFPRQPPSYQPLIDAYQSSLLSQSGKS